MDLKLNVFGNPFGESGYAIHTHGLVTALKKEGLKTGLEIMATPPNWQFLVSPEVKEAIDEQSTYWPTVMITMPESWALKSGDRCKPLIGFGVFEGSKISTSWKMAAQAVDEIWVPSEHTKKAFQASGLMKRIQGPGIQGEIEMPIEVIPHGFDETIFNTNVVPDEKMLDNRFRFLFVGGWRDGEKDRKGLDIALRAFCAEFKKEEKVKFTAKLNMAYQTKEALNANLAALKLPPASERPEIELMVENTVFSKIASLYRSSDCLVIPTKAEAFCMPCLEAMACGIPVIATNYGGQTDYMIRENLLIEVEEMVPATGEPWIYGEAEWAKPSQKNLQELMRFAFENQDTVKKWAATDSQKVLETMTWRHSARKVIERLKKTQGVE